MPCSLAMHLGATITGDSRMVVSVMLSSAYESYHDQSSQMTWLLKLSCCNEKRSVAACVMLETAQAQAADDQGPAC